MESKRDEPFTLSLDRRDIVVVRTAQRLGAGARQALHDRAATLLPGYQVVVLDGTHTMSSVRGCAS